MRRFWSWKRKWERPFPLISIERQERRWRQRSLKRGGGGDRGDWEETCNTTQGSLWMAMEENWQDEMAFLWRRGWERYWEQYVVFERISLSFFYSEYLLASRRQSITLTHSQLYHENIRSLTLEHQRSNTGTRSMQAVGITSTTGLTKDGLSFRRRERLASQYQSQ